MEGIYLTDDEKTVLRKMKDSPSYGIDASGAGISQEKFNIVMTNLESHGLITANSKVDGIGYFLCTLSDKALVYFDSNPKLINPKSRSREKWEDRAIGFITAIALAAILKLLGL